MPWREACFTLGLPFPERNSMDQWEDFAAAFPEIRELPPLTADEIERLAAEYQQAAIDEAHALRPEGDE